MSDDHLDDLVRERFARLRSEGPADVPDFSEMYARARAEAGAAEAPTVIPLVSRRRSWGRGRWAVAGTLAAAALASIMLLRPDSADAEFEALVTAFVSDGAVWQSPTDALLDVPGLELVNSVPTIGGPYGSPLDAPDVVRSSGDVTG